MKRGLAPRRAVALVALALMCAGMPAHAERYRVDLIVFLDTSGTGGEAPLAMKTPDMASALELHESGKLRAAGIELLPDEQFGLTEAWSRLRNSRHHQPVLRLAWLQKDPPAERGPRLRLRWGAPLSALTPSGNQTVYPVDGTVALLAGRFLHLDADFIFTQAQGADLASYLLQERRRLRREELHHLDSPRLGILVRAQRAEVREATPPAPKSPR